MSRREHIRKIRRQYRELIALWALTLAMLCGVAAALIAILLDGNGP